MRQLLDNDLRPPMDDVGLLGSDVREIVERLGIAFAENVHGDEAGPTQYAALALDDGSQFLLIHHYAHPDGFVDLRGQLGLATPQELCRRFADAVGIGESDFLWIAEDWPPPTPLPDGSKLISVGATTPQDAGGRR